MIEDTKSAIQTFITTELRPGGTIADNESLLENGILDSMAITRLISFLEDNFGVAITDEAFEPDNFETVDAIASMVSRLKSS